MIQYYCTKCGNQVDESCPEHPEATIDSISIVDGTPIRVGSKPNATAVDFAADILNAMATVSAVGGAEPVDFMAELEKSRVFGAGGGEGECSPGPLGAGGGGAVLTPIESVSYTPRPQDRRCRYWCKVVRASAVPALPAPANVQGANDVPGPYLRTGDEIELFEGDSVLEGEAVHHSKQRGWSYNLGRVVRAGDGELAISWLDPKPWSRDAKAWLRSQGDRDGLMGSGDVAAMVRILRALAGGFKVE